MVSSPALGEIEMKLYQSNLSPFASRCRIQIYAKGLRDIECCPPPGGMASDEYKTHNPTGKMPALAVDGHVLGESEVICEYLEDRFPTPSLRPAGALERAHVRLHSRVTDLYILDPLFELLPHMNPENRDQAVVDENLALLRTNLAVWEDYLTRSGYSGGGYAVGDALTLADCAMVPALFVAVTLLPMFGLTDPLAATSQLARYWQEIQKDESCGRVLNEMTEGFKVLMSGLPTSAE